MLYSSKSAFLSGCFLLTQDSSGSSVFHFDVLLLRGIRGATYHHHLLRVKTFPGVSPFLNASFWVSWAWMVSQCPPKCWPVGWYCYHSWTIKVHLEAQVALPDGLSPHSAWRLTVHTGLLDAHLPLLKLLHHPLDCLFPQGHAPYLACTLTLHPPAIPRGFSRNERRPMISSPSSGSDTPALRHRTETDCLPSDSLFQQELKLCSDETFIAVYLKKQVDMTNSYVQIFLKKPWDFSTQRKKRWELSEQKAVTLHAHCCYSPYR